jgi:hypothetical protein
LFNFFVHQPELFGATSYEVQIPMPAEDLHNFVETGSNALETGAKVSVTKENAGSVPLSPKNFYMRSSLLSVHPTKSSSGFMIAIQNGITAKYSRQRNCHNSFERR